VLLAGLPQPELEAVLEQVQFQQRGPNTLVDRRALADALGAVREAGIAVNNEELAYGLRSIAVPVRDNSAAVVAAINLAVHRSLVSMEDLVIRLSPALKRTADEISARIGYRPAAA
jgi:IclR family pca regulon transcriptional regulator